MHIDPCIIIAYLSDFDNSFGSKKSRARICFSFLLREASKERPGDGGISLSFLVLLCLLLDLIKRRDVVGPSILF